MSSNDSTINLDDSSVLSSTKNSSVLEVTNDSVINISSDSSDTEGEDEDDTTVNSTSENVDSSSERMLRENSKELSTTEFNSDEELGGEGEVKGKTDAVDDADAEEEEESGVHYVTSNQTLGQDQDSVTVASPDQSSILSATQLLTDISSNQATKDESSIIGDLATELSNNNMKLSESVVEGFGENANAYPDSAIDDLSKELATKIKIINDLKLSSSAQNSFLGDKDNENDNGVVSKTSTDSFNDVVGSEDENTEAEQMNEDADSKVDTKENIGSIVENLNQFKANVDSINEETEKVIEDVKNASGTLNESTDSKVTEEMESVVLNLNQLKENVDSIKERTDKVFEQVNNSVTENILQNEEKVDITQKDDDSENVNVKIDKDQSIKSINDNDDKVSSIESAENTTANPVENSYVKSLNSVDKVIEDTFKDKYMSKSFGENLDVEDEQLNDTGSEHGPGSPHKRKAVKEASFVGESGDVEDTMTLSSSSMTEMPAKRQRTENPDLPPTCQVLVSARSGAKVYLVGTAHFSKESCEDVKVVIENVQPDIVVIELCKARTNLLQLDEETILEEAQNLNLDKSLDIIKSQGTVQGVMYLLLLSMSAHLTKELGMAPGGEFRTAFQEANKVAGCTVHLGDRPINITLKRAINSLSGWQKLKLAWNILTNKDPITKEDVEKCKNKDLLQNMLAEMAGEFPALSSVFVEERDIFLTHSLQMAADAIPAHALGDEGDVEGAGPPTVVGVVGIGHMPGIVARWGAVTGDQVREVVKVEPPSLAARAAVLGVKTLVWAGCLYGAYRVFRGPVSRMLIVSR